ncbi:MAG: hypothetical protein GWN00_40270, partial [Aliifodinibius sp.]|nr:hypothetical protein [Fodinibius sp.]NIV16793.1 hypothetical protein [Fodinibius sp.]NIY30792.1 hypothetical protein [Fodinibius sp.]
VMNRSGGFDTVIYSLPNGQEVGRIKNAHQPSFRGDGLKMLVNGEGGGKDNVWEVNTETWQLEREVSGQPDDS